MDRTTDVKVRLHYEAHHGWTLWACLSGPFGCWETFTEGYYDDDELPVLVHEVGCELVEFSKGYGSRHWFYTAP